MKQTRSCWAFGHRLRSYGFLIADERSVRASEAVWQGDLRWTNKQRHPRRGEDGKPKEYTVSPYQMAAANGRYYLICCTDPHDNVSHYRLDRIADIRMTDEPAQPAKTVQGLEHGIDLPMHMAEHVYMFAGPSETVGFRMKKYLIDDVIDWFGMDIVFSDESEDEVTARVRVNLQAMRRWAVQYGPHIRVLSPKSLSFSGFFGILGSQKVHCVSVDTKPHFQPTGRI